MFDRDVFKAVMGELNDTREEEKLGCDECFEEVDRFIEAELSGVSASEAMPLVHEHLLICGEGRDEFGALLDALRAVEGPGLRDAGESEAQRDSIPRMVATQHATACGLRLSARYGPAALACQLLLGWLRSRSLSETLQG
jgi:hypothetical protein